MRGKDQLKNLGVDGTIKINSVFKKWDGESWTRFRCLRIGKGGGFL